MKIAMRRWRFSPALWPTLAGAFFVLLTCWLGHWQNTRADEKRALQARYDRADRDPPLHASAALDAAAALYRKLEARGVWDDARTILVDNRVQDGVAGYHVLTPLRLAGGGALLVNRGWLAVGRDRAKLPVWRTPPGTVAVEGIALPAHTRYFEFAAAAPSGRVWQNLDFERYRKWSGLALPELVVEQTSASPDGLVRRWPRPDAGVAMHVGYAYQWYGLATLLVVLWLGLNLERVPATPDVSA